MAVVHVLVVVLLVLVRHRCTMRSRYSRHGLLLSFLLFSSLFFPLLLSLSLFLLSECDGGERGGDGDDEG